MMYSYNTVINIPFKVINFILKNNDTKKIKPSIFMIVSKIQNSSKYIHLLMELLLIAWIFNHTKPRNLELVFHYGQDHSIVNQY